MDSMYKRDIECIKQREYLNIPQWHNNGYTGKGVNIFCDDADKSHAECVSDILHVNLPDANIYTGGFNISMKNNKVTSFTVDCRELNIYGMDIEEFIKTYNINLINNSKGEERDTSDDFSEEDKYLLSILKKYNIIMTGAAGNVHDGYIQNPYCNIAIMVNSALLKHGAPIHSMTSIGNKIDFSMFNGWQAGSSFASPCLLSLIGMIRCRYGRDITTDEVYKYLQYYCYDMETIGRDIYTGWGLPILPDTSKKYISMQIGNKYFNNCGTIQEMDVAPVQKEYRTFVPLRFLTEALGYNVKWDENRKQATVSNSKTKIIFTINSKILIVNDNPVMIDVAPFMDNYRTMIPIRCCEYLSVIVDWIEAEQKIMLMEI